MGWVGVEIVTDGVGALLSSEALGRFEGFLAWYGTGMGHGAWRRYPSRDGFLTCG